MNSTREEECSQSEISSRFDWPRSSLAGAKARRQAGVVSTNKKLYSLRPAKSSVTLRISAQATWEVRPDIGP